MLPLFVSRRDLDRVLDTQEIIKIYQKKIYYEYFHFKDRGRVEGFLFIGKNVTITNTLDHFVDNFDVPDILNLYVNKKYNNNGQIDRISHLDKECSKRGLSKKIYDGVSYLEEVIWDSTLRSYIKEEHHRRSDYIDQDLFTYFQEPENLGQGIDYFKGVLSDKFGSSISVIFGRGGVGKTTFCDALKNEIDTGENKKGVFLIKGEQISNLVNFNDIYIESILDLFEAFKVESNLSTLSKSDFSLNYSCGNILVIIDGLDEIDSALGERFNLEKFFSSLSDLDDRFHNTKIILTTRDYFEKNIVSASPLIRKFKLKGFTEKDIEKYKKIKLSNDIQKANFDKLLEVNKLKNNGFSLPVIINLACQAVLDSPDEHIVQGYQSESDFLIGTHVYDSILEYMLTREIDKQKLNTTVDGLFQLLSEIVIDYKNKMSINDLNEYVELTFNENGDKFLKNPLLNVRDNFISIKEEALTSLIKSRYLIYLLKNDISRYEKISDILKDSYKGSGDTYNTLREFVDNTDFDFNATKLIKKLKESEVKTELTYDKLKYRKAISSLLYALLSNKSSFDKNERSDYIYKLLGGKNNIIDGLHIYGDFYSLGFDSYKVMNSSFNEYNKLSDCHFGKENEYIFSFCNFSNINIAKVGDLENCFFENSCKFEKCNIVSVLNTKSDENKKKKENIKSNIISIAKYIGTTQRSFNLIKLNTTVNWNKSHKGFIDELKKLGFIQVDKNGYFRLNKDYYDDLPHITLGRFPKTLNNIVDCLAK
ncbi:NACHT domain-containing protein [Vibrio viridaestus]|uniref:NACHT domain-containing protein n=1 Tax=Vibrio viridaestus TaxID=2487322 RepID=A0A3N9U575_9VIBR|nr:NACHT domain-containing protein [Vibrio viridaestus]